MIADTKKREISPDRGGGRTEECHHDRLQDGAGGVHQLPHNLSTTPARQDPRQERVHWYVILYGMSCRKID